MMISPEGYYERFIKNHNEKEIFREIRRLKREINCLKDTMENPDYQEKPHGFPSESTKIYWYRQYLEKAKEGLLELGKAYVPAKAEQKAEVFQESIPFLEKIVFEIGGFHEGYEKKTFYFDDKHLYLDVNHSIIQKPTNFYIAPDFPMPKDEFLERLKELYIGEWRKKYTAEEYGCIVYDGTQWELELYFSNDHKPVRIYGDNCYPYNFDALLELVGEITWNGEGLYIKQFEKLTNFINGMKTDSFQEWLKDTSKPVDRFDYLILCHESFGEWIARFEKTIYEFDRENPEFQLNRYGTILEENGIKWDKESMENAEVNNLDSQCILALVLGVVRADRFCHGILLHFFKNGAILRWLERLKQIDDKSWDNSFLEINSF